MFGRNVEIWTFQLIHWFIFLTIFSSLLNYLSKNPEERYKFHYLFHSFSFFFFDSVVFMSMEYILLFEINTLTIEHIEPVTLIPKTRFFQISWSFGAYKERFKFSFSDIFLQIFSTINLWKFNNTTLLK